MPASCTIFIHHPGALREMFLRPTMLSLGQAYTAGAFDVQGPMTAALRLGEYLLHHRPGLQAQLRLALQLWTLPPFRPVEEQPRDARLTGHPFSKERARQAVAFHYDLPPEFFQLWLDDKMVYSGAYFLTGDQDLGTAQTQKLDHICRKLGLAPGHRFLDCGCGWGALVVHAANQYGAMARGITLSQQQAAYASQLVRRAGLDTHCRIELLDFRDLREKGWYDRIASVGMVEHVAEPLHREYYAQAYRLLKPGGYFLSQGIAQSPTMPLRTGASFINRHIFPDSTLVPVSTTLKAAEQAGFEIRDVENLREHYALTLQHWLKRLDARREEIQQVTDRQTYRKFRLYLAATAHGFEMGRLQLFQVLLQKPTGLLGTQPMTRTHWYVAGVAAGHNGWDGSRRYGLPVGRF
jgi:cyclopropane-fatty-acyl-phospholipid synthase